MVKTKNSNERFMKLKEAGELIKFRDCYLPVIGKCSMNHLLDPKTTSNVDAQIKPLRVDRFDKEEDAVYKTPNAWIKFSVEEETAKVVFMKEWIGGLVERFENEFDIKYNFIGISEHFEIPNFDLELIDKGKEWKIDNIYPKY